MERRFPQFHLHWRSHTYCDAKIQIHNTAEVFRNAAKSSRIQKVDRTIKIVDAVFEKDSNLRSHVANAEIFYFERADTWSFPEIRGFTRLCETQSASTPSIRPRQDGPDTAIAEHVGEFRVAVECRDDPGSVRDLFSQRRWIRFC